MQHMFYFTDYKLKQTKYKTRTLEQDTNQTLTKNSQRQGRNTGLESSGTNELDQITRGREK